MNNNVAICLQLAMDMIEFVQERFDKVLSNTEYQVVIALNLHFRFLLMLDADNQFYQFTSEYTSENMKTKIISMVESLLNEDLHATSNSNKTEKAVKQDDFLFKSKNGNQSTPKLLVFFDASS